MIKPLIYISINNASAESLKYMNGFPSPDTLLRRLESLNLSHVVDALNSANRIVLSSHVKDGMKMAIDFTEEPYYGKLDMYVTSVSNNFTHLIVIGYTRSRRPLSTLTRSVHWRSSGSACPFQRSGA